MVLVVIVALIGFWSWRTAVLDRGAMPITLAITSGVVMNSSGSTCNRSRSLPLIIALGLLVDVPVSIERRNCARTGRGQTESLGSVAAGQPKLFKTMAVRDGSRNIASYLPFLLLSGDTGKFLYSLPIVISCSLLAALLVDDVCPAD